MRCRVSAILIIVICMTKAALGGPEISRHLPGGWSNATTPLSSTASLSSTTKVPSPAAPVVTTNKEWHGPFVPHEVAKEKELPKHSAPSAGVSKGAETFGHDMSKEAGGATSAQARATSVHQGQYEDHEAKKAQDKIIPASAGLWNGTANLGHDISKGLAGGTPAQAAATSVHQDRYGNQEGKKLQDNVKPASTNKASSYFSALNSTQSDLANLTTSQDRVNIAKTFNETTLNVEKAPPLDKNKTLSKPTNETTPSRFFAGLNETQAVKSLNDTHLNIVKYPVAQNGTSKVQNGTITNSTLPRACPVFGTMTSSLLPSGKPNADCCGKCYIGGPNVDVFYWPEPNADKSCLSVIGDAVNPPRLGATTTCFTQGVGGCATYWGEELCCQPGTPTGQKWIKTTAVWTTVNGVSFKAPMFNPWTSEDNYLGLTRVSQAETISLAASTLPVNPKPLHRRAPANESMHISAANINVGPNIVTVDGHTFTSPTIYVNFYSLQATDSCGFLGPQIPSTMLEFAPGELSTLAGPMRGPVRDFVLDASGALALPQGPPTSVYNFADLPCPPLKVQSDHWYKPEAGEPYRPLIAFPSKLLGLDPLWKSCEEDVFTGLDPPRGLDRAEVLVAPVVTAAAEPVHAETIKPADVPPSPAPKETGQTQVVDPGGKKPEEQLGPNQADVPVVKSAPAPQPQPQPQPVPANQQPVEKQTVQDPPPPQVGGTDSQLPPVDKPSNDDTPLAPAAQKAPVNSEGQPVSQSKTNPLPVQANSPQPAQNEGNTNVNQGSTNANSPQINPAAQPQVAGAVANPANTVQNPSNPQQPALPAQKQDQAVNSLTNSFDKLGLPSLPQGQVDTIKQQNIPTSNDASVNNSPGSNAPNNGLLGGDSPNKASAGNTPAGSLPIGITQGENPPSNLAADILHQEASKVQSTADKAGSAHNQAVGNVLSTLGDAIATPGANTAVNRGEALHNVPPSQIQSLKSLVNEAGKPQADGSPALPASKVQELESALDAAAGNGGKGTQPVIAGAGSQPLGSLTPSAAQALSSIVAKAGTPGKNGVPTLPLSQLQGLNTAINTLSGTPTRLGTTKSLPPDSVPAIQSAIAAAGTRGDIPATEVPKLQAALEAAKSGKPIPPSELPAIQSAIKAAGARGDIPTAEVQKLQQAVKTAGTPSLAPTISTSEVQALNSAVAKIGSHGDIPAEKVKALQTAIAAAASGTPITSDQAKELQSAILKAQSEGYIPPAQAQILQAAIKSASSPSTPTTISAPEVSALHSAVTSLASHGDLAPEKVEELQTAIEAAASGTPISPDQAKELQSAILKGESEGYIPAAQAQALQRAIKAASSFSSPITLSAPEVAVLHSAITALSSHGDLSPEKVKALESVIAAATYGIPIPTEKLKELQSVITTANEKGYITPSQATELYSAIAALGSNNTMAQSKEEELNNIINAALASGQITPDDVDELKKIVSAALDLNDAGDLSYNSTTNSTSSIGKMSTSIKTVEPSSTIEGGGVGLPTESVPIEGPSSPPKPSAKAAARALRVEGWVWCVVVGGIGMFLWP